MSNIGNELFGVFAGKSINGEESVTGIPDQLDNFAKFLKNSPGQGQDSKNLMEILPYLLTLQNMKETQYGRSWCKHKDFSAYFNVERKWDRIFNIFGKVIEKGLQVLDNAEDTGTPTETFIDTVADLGLYSLMWVGLMKELRPEQFENFLKNNGLYGIFTEKKI